MSTAPNVRLVARPNLAVGTTVSAARTPGTCRRCTEVYGVTTTLRTPKERRRGKCSECMEETAR